MAPWGDRSESVACLTMNQNFAVAEVLRSSSIPKQVIAKVPHWRYSKHLAIIKNLFNSYTWDIYKSMACRQTETSASRIKVKPLFLIDLFCLLFDTHTGSAASQ
jgi:hypothetical protein